MRRKGILFSTCLLIILIIVLSGCSGASNKKSGFYNEINKVDDKIIDTMIVSDSSMSEESKKLQRITFTRSYKVDKLIKKLGYDYNMSAEYKARIRFPESFDSIVNKVDIGKFLEQKNELSKKWGFDFSDYMGKELFLIEEQLLKYNVKSGYIITLFDSDCMVGAWRDETNDNQDGEKLLSGGVIAFQ